MINKKKNIFENIDFKIFASQIGEVIKDAFEKFIEQDIKVSLQAVNDFREIREEKLTKNIDFFSSQIKVENHKPIIVRFSRDFIESFFDSTLARCPRRTCEATFDRLMNCIWLDGSKGFKESMSFADISKFIFPLVVEEENAKGKGIILSNPYQ